jgi:hypothetical protein
MARTVEPFTSQFDAARIERLRHQSLIVQEQNMTGGVSCHGFTLHQLLRLQSSKFPDMDDRRFSSTGRARPVKKMFAVRQEPWPPVTVFASRRIQFRNGLRGSTRCRHAK